MTPTIKCPGAALQGEPGSCPQQSGMPRDFPAVQNLLLSQASPSQHGGGANSRKVTVAPAASVQLSPPAVPRMPKKPAPLATARAWLHSLFYLYSWVAAKCAKKN